MNFIHFFADIKARLSSNTFRNEPIGKLKPYLYQNTSASAQITNVYIV